MERPEVALPAMDGAAAKSPSGKEKRVSFGPVTVIPIPRRGKLSLSASTGDEDGDLEEPARETSLGERPQRSLPPQPAHPSSLSVSRTCAGGELLEDSLSPANESSSQQPQRQEEQPGSMLCEQSASQSMFTESQMDYLQHCAPFDIPLAFAFTNFASGGTAGGTESTSPEDEEILRPPVAPALLRAQSKRSRSLSSEGSRDSPSSRKWAQARSPPIGMHQSPSADSSSSPRESSTQRFATALGDFLGVSPRNERGRPPCRGESPQAPNPVEVALADSAARLSRAGSSLAVADALPETAAATAVGAVRDQPPRVARRLEVDDSEESIPSTPLPQTQRELPEAAVIRCIFCGVTSDADTPTRRSSTSSACGATASPQTSPSAGGSSSRRRRSPVAHRHREAPQGEASPPPTPPAGFMHQDGLWFHTACALWCPEVYFDPTTQRLRHVREAVRRCKDIKCAICRHTGASIGCASADCQLSFHLPCAIRHRKGRHGKGAVQLDRTSFVLRCALHRLS